MAILTGHEIQYQINHGSIRIGNFNSKNIQPNSYDLTLGRKVSYYKLRQHSHTYSGADLSSRPVYEHLRANVIDVRALARDRYSRTSSITYQIPYLDTAKENDMVVEDIPDNGYILLPNTLYLVETNESVWSDKYVAEVSGISSLARLGITIHKTAGYSNLGHEFKWILEVEVSHPVKVYPNMRIGQMYFHTTEGSTISQYDGKYLNLQMSGDLCGSMNHLDNE